MKNAFLILFFWLFQHQALASQTKIISCPEGQASPIYKAMYVKAQGIKQWLSIRSEDCHNPLLLMVHGGPGSPVSYFSNDHFKKLEKHFTVVYWDQRGSGKTLQANLGEHALEDYMVEQQLSVQQLVTDGIAISQWLLQQFNQPKLLLRGGSWGSYLAIRMAQQEPDLFLGYVGHAQLVDAREKHLYNFQTLLNQAKLNKDKQAITQLEALGKPPYQHPRAYGQLYRLVRQFEKTQATPSSLESHYLEGYDTKEATKFRAMGDDYSWMQFVGFSKIGIKGMLDDINLHQHDYHFEIPLVILQGEKDQITPSSLTKAYFNKIKAPVKQLISIENSGHSPSDDLLNREFEILKFIAESKLQ